MKWVKDQTGRFAFRPHYLPEELDAECEKLIADFLLQQHGKIDYPISTEDLTVLIETLTDDLDLYANLSDEDGEVEGVTDFFRERPPKVRISKRLTLDTRLSNRLRTTLTHELGHIKFHASMFQGQTGTTLLTPLTGRVSNRCKRDSMLQASERDWMEWQAGFACGAFLMPATALRTTIRQFIQEQQISIACFEVNSTLSQALITEVSNVYAVSREAARVRLLRQGTLSEAPLSGNLF